MPYLCRISIFFVFFCGCNAESVSCFGALSPFMLWGNDTLLFIEYICCFIVSVIHVKNEVFMVIILELDSILRFHGKNIMY